MAKKAIISTTVKGKYKKTYDFLDRCSDGMISFAYLNRVGIQGVKALQEGTPVDSGKTKDSWTYYVNINKAKGIAVVEWHNTNLVDGHNVAIMLQYGHQTKNGSWVYGRDYINPAMQPLFDKMADEMWTKVVSK